jgi:hypothetical protein
VEHAVARNDAAEVVKLGSIVFQSFAPNIGDRAAGLAQNSLRPASVPLVRAPAEMDVEMSAAFGYQTEFQTDASVAYSFLYAQRLADQIDPRVVM